MAILALMRNVHAKLTDNPGFTTPRVPLAEMATLADALEAAIERATNGSKADREQRNALVLQAKAVLSAQADYVRSVANGDRALLATTGYELRRTPQPIGLPASPVFKAVRMTGRLGEAELRWGTVEGADAYQVRMSTEDPALGGKWELVGVTTKVRHLATHLESYRAYWFCVTAIGAAGESAFSDPVLARAA